MNQQTARMMIDAAPIVMAAASITFIAWKAMSLARASERHVTSLHQDIHRQYDQIATIILKGAELGCIKKRSKRKSALRRMSVSPVRKQHRRVIAQARHYLR